jgi:hypothetical protein
MLFNVPSIVVSLPCKERYGAGVMSVCPFTFSLVYILLCVCVIRKDRSLQLISVGFALQYICCALFVSFT